MAHTQATGLEITKHILEHSKNIAEAEEASSGTVQSALEKSLEKAQEQCSATRAQVATLVLDIMECHVLVDQVGMFLGAIYQALCSQQ